MQGATSGRFSLRAELTACTDRGTELMYESSAGGPYFWNFLVDHPEVGR